MPNPNTAATSSAATSSAATSSAATSSAAAPVPPVLSADDAARIETLRAELPEGWTVKVEAAPGLMWTALVYRRLAPLDGLVFVVSRGTPRQALGVITFPDGEALRTDFYAGLGPILDPIPEAISALMATVDAEG